jgi:3-deoxy-D-manno-octulosonic-acid transferase
MTILHRIYPALSMLLSISIVPIFLCFKRGRARLGERFGLWKISPAFLEGHKDLGLVWFHGASMGEMKGLLPIVKRFREEFPEVAVLVTATSVSAFPVIEHYADEVHLLPFDSPVWVSNILKRIQPTLFVCGETEVWPALYLRLAEEGVPLVLVNARLSLQSFRSFHKMRVLFTPILLTIARVLASERRSAERFHDLGVPKSRVAVAGNAKYDSEPSIRSDSEREEIRSRHFADTAPIIVLGSIWPEEEKLWFPVIAECLERDIKINFIVAPRHSEKFDLFALLLKQYKIPFIRRSQDFDGGIASRVILLDTLGELEGVYSVASLAFIGGSVRKDVGGHNPLEAAAYGVPIAMGKHREVVEEICEVLKEAPGLFEISTEEDVRSLIEMIIQKPDVMRHYGEGAHATWKSYCGATERIVSALGEEYVRSAVRSKENHVVSHSSSATGGEV